MNINETFEVHDKLNPKLWENNKLKEDVRDSMLEVVKQFVSTLSLPMKVLDVHFVGSMASFNYTKYSDIDLHIVTSFDSIECSEEIAQILFNSLKSSFNSNYNITIKGIEVEVYVEDVKSGANSNGIYSVLNDSWIKFPKKLDNIPQIDISDKLNTWKNKINSALNSKDSNTIENLIDELYIIRKNALDTTGEYSEGNQLFKELRNLGLLDELKDKYREFRSNELTLENLKPLHEDSRNALLGKSKKSVKGNERFKKRVKSRVANSVKQFNAIDMNKLFKDDILTVDISVKGETDNYIVKITFGGFLQLLQDQLSKHNNVLDYKAVTRALILGFNKDDVYIHCSCPDWNYRFSYYATRNNITSGDPENRPSDITNPDDSLGSGCKHVLLVLSNTSWILKVASTIYNYINYMEKHYKKLYADIIYPAIYGKDYEEPVQLDIFDDDTLETDSDTIDKSNEFARTKNQFKQGNKEGVRFDSTEESPQITIDDTLTQ